MNPEMPKDLDEYEAVLTLRDWFAGQCLSAIISLESDATPLEQAKDAYLYADQMLVARRAKR